MAFTQVAQQSISSHVQSRSSLRTVLALQYVGHDMVVLRGLCCYDIASHTVFLECIHHQFLQFMRPRHVSLHELC